MDPVTVVGANQATSSAQTKPTVTVFVRTSVPRFDRIDEGNPSLIDSLD